MSLDKKIVATQAVSSAEMRFTTPPHDNGIASLKVTNSAGHAHAEFLYVPPRLEELPPGHITTIAGIGNATGFYRRATEAEISPQGNLAFDKQGNLYVTEPGKARVSRIRADGVFEPFAGNGETGSDGDGGAAEESKLWFPRGVAVDDDGTVYIADSQNRIRRVDPQTRIITTIAGDGTPGFSGDGGPARQAKLSNPTKLAGDGKGTIFFIDWGNGRIRRITPDGFISTVAGNGVLGFSGDNGPATLAQFNFHEDYGAMALDPGRFLYLADTANKRVRRINLQTQIIDTFIGPPEALVDEPFDVALGPDGNLFYTTFGRIHVVNPGGQLIATYGRKDIFGWSEDGTPLNEIRLQQSDGLVIDSVGNIVFSHFFKRVRRINLSTGRLETVGGIGPSVLGENGRAIATTFMFGGEGDLALLPTGELVIADGGNLMLRKVGRNGMMSTIARGGAFAPAEWAGVTFGGGSSIKPDAIGNLLITDAQRVYRLGADGILRIVAGARGGCGLSGDGGPAIDAELCQPFHATLDTDGNYFIADTNNNRIRRVDAKTGIITTFVGSGPVNGHEGYNRGAFCGDGGPALAACLNTPQGVGFDQPGNLYIGDRGNRRIRIVDGSGAITTFAADMTGPGKIAFDSVGRVYARSVFGVFRFERDGTSTPVACHQMSGFSGDGGPALEARCSPAGAGAGVAIDDTGNIFFMDGGNARIRAIRYGAVLAPPGATIQASAIASTIRATVRDSRLRGAPGVRVEFNAPASSPSCRFPNGSASIGVITDESGIAVTTCTPECGASGTILVTAQPITATATATATVAAAAGPCRRRAVRR